MPQNGRRWLAERLLKGSERSGGASL